MCSCGTHVNEPGPSGLRLPGNNVSQQHHLQQLKPSTSGSCPRRYGPTSPGVFNNSLSMAPTQLTHHPTRMQVQFEPHTTGLISRLCTTDSQVLHKVDWPTYACILNRGKSAEYESLCLWPIMFRSWRLRLRISGHSCQHTWWN